MDGLAPLLPAPKRRRKHTPEFKLMVLRACEQSGNSVAGVARQYRINANLVHKWRRKQALQAIPDFVRVPSVVTPDPVPAATVLIRLPGGIEVEWPVDAIDGSVRWLKALMP